MVAIIKNKTKQKKKKCETKQRVSKKASWKILRR